MLQTKMAASLERKSAAFNAAEAALAGVVYETEDEMLLTKPLNIDPLSEARQVSPSGFANQEMSCFDANPVVRIVTSHGMTRGKMHITKGKYGTYPQTNSWSKSAFVREQACRGSSMVIGASNIMCHVFLVRGCGQIVGSNYAIANTMLVSVFAPASN
jgi:type IV pilus assembly protein PilX